MQLFKEFINGIKIFTNEDRELISRLKDIIDKFNNDVGIIISMNKEFNVKQKIISQNKVFEFLTKDSYIAIGVNSHFKFATKDYSCLGIFVDAGDFNHYRNIIMSNEDIIHNNENFIKEFEENVNRIFDLYQAQIYLEIPRESINDIYYK